MLKNCPYSYEDEGSRSKDFVIKKNLPRIVPQQESRAPQSSSAVKRDTASSRPSSRTSNTGSVFRGRTFLRRVRKFCAEFCGGKDTRGCNQTFAAWKSFRKDWRGAVAVPIEDLDYPSRNFCRPPSLEDAPPPYHEQQQYESDKAGDALDSYDDCSMETGGSSINRGDDGGEESPWCKILYWEGRERKGSGFPVTSSVIDILGDTPHGSGLSLAALFGGRHHDQRVMKTRKKICQGLVLWREEEAVWVYNRSDAPIYLNSASLDGSFYHLNLYKCPPGYAMIIYYYEMARHLTRLPEYRTRCMDKADVNSVRISFAKGWGANYQRREILCCPCWLEVHVLKVDQPR